jgi:threonine/homoserine/homoserine lactone efflux protein
LGFSESGVALVYFKGMLIGLFIAAPVGPIAMLCISRTLTDGTLSGLATGLGAATADATYGIVAGFGITAIYAMMIEHELWMKLVGGGLLCLMGLKVVFFPPPLSTSVVPKTRLHGGLLVDFWTTFFLTLANPVTLIAFAAAFAGMGQGDVLTFADAGIMVLGVFCGSAFWWLALSFSADRIRRWLNPRVLGIAHRVIGIAIAIFGGVVLASALFDGFGSGPQAG